MIISYLNTRETKQINTRKFAEDNILDLGNRLLLSLCVFECFLLYLLCVCYKFIKLEIVMGGICDEKF